MKRCGAFIFTLAILLFAGLPSRADFVVSGCADISRPGRYILDRDITGTMGSACLRIHDGADIHLDCAGHSVTTGEEGLAAIVIATVKNFTLKACRLPQRSGYSLFVGNSSDGVITGNRIKNMVVNQPGSSDATLRVIGNHFSEFENAELDTPLSGANDGGVIPIESGVNWIMAKAMIDPAAPEGSSSVSQVSGGLQPRVFPNPWRADRDNRALLTFDRLPPNSTVKIFTLSAQWVRTLTAVGTHAEWDLRNDAGEDVASGLYLYLITNGQGDKASGKLAIIR